MKSKAQAARKGWLLLLGVLAFTCGLWGAGWTACQEGYYNCPPIPHCIWTKIIGFCAQSQGAPNCECCVYQTTYFDCNRDGVSDCVDVSLIASSLGDYQCNPSVGECVLQTCPGYVPPP